MNHIESIVRRSLWLYNMSIPLTFTQICETVDKLLSNPLSASLIAQLNPTFRAPSRPFLRLSYVDAIRWLNEHGIQHEAEDAAGNVIRDAETGAVVMVEHRIGDDIAESAERQMTDVIGAPVFLYGFPAELKAFYMKKIEGRGGEGPLLTESCDLLMPGVGEIVGALKLFCVFLFGIDDDVCRWIDEDCGYGGAAGGV